PASAPSIAARERLLVRARAPPAVRPRSVPAAADRPPARLACPPAPTPEPAAPSSRQRIPGTQLRVGNGSHTTGLHLGNPCPSRPSGYLAPPHPPAAKMCP